MHHEHAGPETRDPLEVELVEHVEATPEEVFDYLTDSTCFPGVSEEASVVLRDLLVSEPPHRIQWRVEFEGERGAYPGTVDVTLMPDGTGTRIRIVHHTERQPRTLAPCGPQMLALAA